MIINVKPANKLEKVVAFFFPQKIYKISYTYCLLLPSLLAVVYNMHVTSERTVNIVIII